MARPIQPEQSELVKKTVFSYIVSSAKFKYNLTENRIKFALLDNLSNEANTNLIAHNNDRLPLRTSSLSEETKTNLIAHNNSGLIFSLSCCL